MDRKHRILLIVVILLIGAIYLLFPRRISEPQQTPVRVLAIVPLTGKDSGTGIAIRQGVETAIRELEEKEEGLKRLSFDWQDSEGNPEKAAKIATDLGKDAAIVVSSPGSVTESVSAKIGPEIPHITSDFEGYPTRGGPSRFGTWVSLPTEIDYFLKRAQVLAPKKVVVISSNDSDVEQALESQLLSGIGELGIEEVLLETLEPSTDYDLLRGKVDDYQPQLLIAIASADELKQVVPRIHDYRTKGEAELLTSFSIMDAAPALTEEQLEGIRFVAPTFLTDHKDRELQRVWQLVSHHNSVEGTYAHAYGYALAKWLGEAVDQGAFEEPNERLKTLHANEAVIFGAPFRFSDQGILEIPVELGGYLGGKVRHLPE